MLHTLNIIIISNDYYFTLNQMILFRFKVNDRFVSNIITVHSKELLNTPLKPQFQISSRHWYIIGSLTHSDPNGNIVPLRNVSATIKLADIPFRKSGNATEGETGYNSPFIISNNISLLHRYNCADIEFPVPPDSFAARDFPDPCCAP